MKLPAMRWKGTPLQLPPSITAAAPGSTEYANPDLWLAPLLVASQGLPHKGCRICQHQAITWLTALLTLQALLLLLLLQSGHLYMHLTASPHQLPGTALATRHAAAVTTLQLVPLSSCTLLWMAVDIAVQKPPSSTSTSSTVRWNPVIHAPVLLCRVDIHQQASCASQLLKASLDSRH